jgi:hypothetical protein
MMPTESEKTERRILVSLRVKTGDDPKQLVDGTTRGVCSQCESEVWLTPAGVDIRNAGAEVVCLECLHEVVTKKATSVRLESPTMAQLDEITKTLAGKCAVKTEHFRVVCPRCGKVVRQCRCMSKEKTTTTEICSACAKEEGLTGKKWHLVEFENVEPGGGKIRMSIELDPEIACNPLVSIIRSAMGDAVESFLLRMIVLLQTALLQAPDKKGGES